MRFQPGWGSLEERRGYWKAVVAIAAKNARFSVPTHPDWDFVPLVTELGDLAAQSTLRF